MHGRKQTCISIIIQLISELSTFELQNNDHYPPKISLLKQIDF